MCGICGEYNASGAEMGRLARMSESLAHRGPDDEGTFLSGPIGLACRRLSIIDTEGGHQPIGNEDGTIWIVFNGEIYNYRSLRKDLEAQGHVFSTRSDTEVIVHLYEEDGERCVEKLSGMFAFAIWDGNARRLILARDRIGQKPLFYARDGERFVFASELKAILAAYKGGRELDLESLHHYLSLRFIPAPKTMLRGIMKLPPASLLVLEDGAERISPYWSLSFDEKLDLPEDELLEALHERLAGTIAIHLVSDVPVGALLSGGMDSSMVVALMAKASTEPFKTFSIGVEQQSFNELPYAALVAQRYGTEHIESSVSSDLITLLPRMISHLDEPSDPIAACTFHAAELASRHVKVALGGDGGDELFGGFDRYLGVRYVDTYDRIPRAIRRWLLRPLLELLPESFAYKGWTQKLRWAERLSSTSNPARRYAEATSFFRFTHSEKSQLFTDSLWRQLHHLDSNEVIVRAYNQPLAADPLDRMIYADYVTRLAEHSLMLTDRMSMAHGLELRSPFLDHELVEFLAAFPSRLKIRDGTLKFALRRLAADYLPAQIVRRRKQGFMFPVAHWFRRDLHPFLRSFLSDALTVRQGIFARPTVEKLIEEHRRAKIDHHVRIWMLLNVEIWFQMYLEGATAESMVDRIQSCI